MPPARCRINPMKVALTGASGFIGSYTATSLHRSRHQVRALVRESSRRDHIAPHVSEWTIGSQSDPRTIDELVAGVDIVIHNSVDWSARDQSPLDNFQNNVLGSLRLLEASRL